MIKNAQIKNALIENEIKNWRDLKSNSEKMSSELNNRISEIKNNLDL